MGVRGVVSDARARLARRHGPVLSRRRLDSSSARHARSAAGVARPLRGGNLGRGDRSADGAGGAAGARMIFESAERIADAVLFEGYVLYPYRASAVKNRLRWQFGVLVPGSWSVTGGEPREMQTECLIEPRGSPSLDLQVRFLQIQVRTGEDPAAPWEEGVERTVDLRGLPLDYLSEEGWTLPFEIA